MFKNIIYNCKKATLLVVKKKEHQLTIREKIQLYIHLHYCKPCKRFVEQSDLIDNALHQSENVLLDPPVYLLPEQAKVKIKQGLEENY